MSSLTPKKDLPPVPFKAILTSVPFYALMIAQVGHNFGIFIMIIDLPKYMADVLKFSIKENGVYSALPFATMFLVGNLTGFVSDYIIHRKFISRTNARKMFTTIAAFGPGIFMLAATYSECNRMLVVAMFTIGMGFMGTFYSGLKANNLDLAPNYAATVMAFTNGAGGFTGIIVPYLVGVVTPDVGFFCLIN